MPERSEVRVIIVNYNAGAYLARCLQALLNQTFTSFEAVVVDNGSGDNSLQAVPSDPRFSVRRLGANRGFAAANNIGAADSAARWIATLNPDAFPQTDWLEKLVAAAKSHPRCTMFGSTQILADAPDYYDGTGDCLLAWGFAWRGNFRWPVVLPAPSGEVFGPCAAAALYDCATYQKLGGFDERFFCYSEDVDLALRMRLAGSRCLQVGEAVVYHVSSGIAGQGSDFAFYHGFRNQIWMMLKGMPAPLLILLLPGHVLILALMMLWSVRRGRATPIWRGARDAVRGLRPILESRRHVQAQRQIGVIALARALTWNPFKFLAQRADVRPWREDQDDTR